MRTLTIDSIPRFVVEAGIARVDAVLDGSFAVVDLSRRNRNHRVTWGEGAGILLKQAGGPFGLAQTLKNEADFYAACARIAEGRRLPLVEVVEHFDDMSLLAMRWLGNARPLWDYRRTTKDPDALYSSIGRALGAMHAFTTTPAFRRDDYGEALPPPSAPWVTHLHKPAAGALRHVSSAQVSVLRILQGEKLFGHHLESVAAALRPGGIIHGDLKADNLLIEDTPEGPNVTIADWELAQRGDPAWDLGAMLADTLAAWLEIMQPVSGEQLGISVASAEDATRLTHSACRALWDSYHTTVGLAPTERADMLARAVLFSAAHLVRVAYETSAGGDTIGSNVVAMLQVAFNLFEQPREGMHVLYGFSDIE